MMTNHKVCQDITGSCGWSRVLSHCSTALRGQGTIITVTSEEDKYCTRTDCGILERGQFEEEEGGRGGGMKKKKKRKKKKT